MPPMPSQPWHPTPCIARTPDHFYTVFQPNISRPLLADCGIKEALRETVTTTVGRRKETARYLNLHHHGHWKGSAMADTIEKFSAVYRSKLPSITCDQPVCSRPAGELAQGVRCAPPLQNRQSRTHYNSENNRCKSW